MAPGTMQKLTARIQIGPLAVVDTKSACRSWDGRSRLDDGGKEPSSVHGRRGEVRCFRAHGLLIDARSAWSKISANGDIEAFCLGLPRAPAMDAGQVPSWCIWDRRVDGAWHQGQGKEKGCDLREGEEGLRERGLWMKQWKKAWEIQIDEDGRGGRGQEGCRPGRSNARARR